jgi:hypothetical protein
MTLHYQITLKEYLEESWSASFDGLTISHTPNGSTTLAGAVRDQTALYGLIAKIRDLGLTLLAVEPGIPPAQVKFEERGTSETGMPGLEGEG